MASATQLARTTESRIVKNYVNGVTIGGKVCGTVAECLDLARKVSICSTAASR